MAEAATLSSRDPVWYPACVVFENRDAVKIVAELPEVRPGGVELTLKTTLRNRTEPFPGHVRIAVLTRRNNLWTCFATCLSMSLA